MIECPKCGYPNPNGQVACYQCKTGLVGVPRTRKRRQVPQVPPKPPVIWPWPLRILGRTLFVVGCVLPFSLLFVVGGCLAWYEFGLLGALFGLFAIGFGLKMFIDGTKETLRK